MKDKEEKINSLRTKIKSFVVKTINLCKTLPDDKVGRVLTNQLLRSSTSIGANFEESVEAESNKDVIHKLSVVKKEAKETKYWLDLIPSCFPTIKTEDLLNESDEIVRIFSSIIHKRKNYQLPNNEK